MQKKNIHTIWSNEIHIKDWVGDRESIMEDRDCCDGCKDKNCEQCDSFWNEIHDLNSLYFEDELANLDKEIPGLIVAFADLGLWNGRRPGYKILTNNLKSILSINEDYNTYYADGRNVKATCHHHDGTNYIVYRMLKPNIEREAFEDFMYAHDYKLDSAQMSRFTTSILPYVKKVYGWQ